MIARMSKYDLVLYAGQSSDFIEKLRGLGLVDITTTGWEPSDEDRQLLLSIAIRPLRSRQRRSVRRSHACRKPPTSCVPGAIFRSIRFAS